MLRVLVVLGVLAASGCYQRPAYLCHPGYAHPTMTTDAISSPADERVQETSEGAKGRLVGPRLY